MEAAVILQRCGQSRKAFGIRCQKMEDGEWYRTWAFPVDESRASREGDDKTEIVSLLPATADYPGCPYCGSNRVFYDSNCGKLSCYHGETVFTCPWCNTTYSDLGTWTEKASFTGGDI